MSQSFLRTIALIKSDMQARCDYENKPLNWMQIIKLVMYPASMSCVIYRIQMFFYHHHLTIFASLLKAINGVIYTVHIDSKTEIGEGFFIMHASFIHIGRNVSIGKNCMMAHQNSVSASPFYSADLHSTDFQSSKGPTLGDHVMLGGGAGIFGNVVIGNHVQVSMNSVVENSFGDHAVLFGLPAKNLTKTAVEE